jgi:hypothetical protein
MTFDIAHFDTCCVCIGSAQARAGALPRTCAKAGEQDALRQKLQKKKLGFAEARPARFVVRRRQA